MITLSFSKSLMAELESLRILALSNNHLRLYRISQGLLWLGEGRAVGEIAGLLNVSRRTIYVWLSGLMTRGIRYLQHERYKGRGRKARLDKAAQQALVKAVKAGPKAAGFEVGVWNSSLINEWIFRHYQVSYNPRYLCRLLKKLGLSYMKAGFVTHPVDEVAYREARRLWVEETWPGLVRQAKEEQAVILFGDEVSFAQWGSLSYTWGERGTQPLVKTTGLRKGLKMYGVIECQGGAFHAMESLQYELKPKSFRALKEDGLPAATLALLKPMKGECFKTREAFITALEQVLGKEQAGRLQRLLLQHTETSGRFNKEGYIEFLKQVLQRFPGKVLLVEDGAPYHRAAAVREFTESTQGRLQRVALPKFSPDCNPIEKLWKNTKRDATHLQYFEDFEALREAVHNVFRGYLADASKVLCVMKSLREKAGFVAG